jgi:hypothetical protein
MQHNRPKVVDCLHYEEGYYAGFYENGGSILMCDTWLPCHSLRRIVQDLLKVSAAFAIQTERDKVPEIISRLFDSSIPFASKKRYDLDNSYFRVSEGAFNSYMTQISAAAAWKDRLHEKEAANNVGKSVSDIPTHKWSFDDAATAFSKGLRGLMDLIATKTTLYDTFKFEKEFNMIWCCGPEKCLKPMPCETVCQLPDLPPGGDKPTPPDKPIQHPSGRDIKRAFVDEGLTLRNFHVHIDNLSFLECIYEDHEKLHVYDMSDNIVLSADRIVFYTDKVETEEICNNAASVRLWVYDSKNKTLRKEKFDFEK